MATAIDSQIADLPAGQMAEFLLTDLLIALNGSSSGDDVQYLPGSILKTSLLDTLYQPLDAELTALAGLTSAADKLPYFTGSGTAALVDFTSFGRSLVDDANAAAGRTTLGVVIGTDVQAWDTQLDDIAALAVTDGNFIVGDGANWVAENGATARTSLGLGSIATQAASSVSISGGSITGITDLAIAEGGTGQSTAQAAIDALSAVSGATDEHVLTKDTASGNAIFKASAGGSSLPVTDTTSIVEGSADPTKEIRFEVDGLTTGTTRVLTPPDADFTLAGLEVANVFTAAQKIDILSATALLVEDDGVNDDVLLVDTSTPRVTITGTGLSINGSTTYLLDDGVAFMHSGGGTGNLFIGDGAGSVVEVTAEFNFGAGFETLNSLTTGDANWGAGYRVLKNNTTGNENVGAGREALTNNTTGFRNVGIGFWALRLNTTGQSNVALGTQALQDNNAGISNCAILPVAMQRNTTGSSNIAINGLRFNTTGDFNIALGAAALSNSQTGDGNIGIGRSAGTNAAGGTFTGADYNIIIGYIAGKGLAANMDKNIYIGFNAGSLATGSSQLYIADSDTATPLIYGDFSAGLLTFHTVDAGTATITETLSLIHNISGTPLVGFGEALSLKGKSSTTESQDMALFSAEWATATHATRKALVKLNVYDTAIREGIRIEASGTVAMLGFYGVTAVVRPTALTTALTQITHTGPGTPDYAIATPIDSGVASAWGFSTQDEFETVMSVILNLQTRVDELETKQQALGLLT